LKSLIKKNNERDKPTTNGESLLNNGFEVLYLDVINIEILNIRNDITFIDIRIFVSKLFCLDIAIVMIYKTIIHTIVLPPLLISVFSAKQFGYMKSAKYVIKATKNILSLDSILAKNLSISGCKIYNP